MTPTPLVRNSLRDFLRKTQTAHPGLLIQRGWTDFVKTDASNAGSGGKTEHIRRICDVQAPDIYGRAFERWLNITADRGRFDRCAMRIQGRLFVGLSGGGALETGCAVSQSLGMPYLPGSSIKGVVRAWAETNLSGEPDIKRQLFGTEPTEIDKQGISGLMTFHDAWWIPNSGANGHKNKPFAEDVVTPHHSEYYGSDGNTPATDLDSPIPNGMIGVRGSFLFTLEGDAAWLKLARSMLEKALAENGIGAKTASGYGYLSLDQKAIEDLEKELAKKSAEQNFAKAKLLRNVGTGELRATLLDGNRTTAPVKGATAQAWLDKLPDEVRNGKKIKEGKLVVEITVRENGNMLEITGLRPCAG